MTNTATGSSATDLQLARAGRLRDLIEPWSLRKLESRTGLGRNYLSTRLSGTVALSISDVEVLAPVIRMTPAELFAELLTVGNDEKAPTPKGGGSSLPGLDSNQEPAGSQPDNVIWADFGSAA